LQFEVYVNLQIWPDANPIQLRKGIIKMISQNPKGTAFGNVNDRMILAQSVFETTRSKLGYDLLIGSLGDLLVPM